MEWESKKLSDVCEKITDGTHQTPKYFDSGHIFLSSKNVTSGKIDWTNVRYIDDAQHEEMQRRISPRVGDILLAKNGTTGVAAMVDRDVCFDIYVSLAFLRPLNFIEPKFLLHFINSPLAKEQFNERLKGIGVPNLHLKEIREVRFSFPLIPEQKRIVAMLDQAFADIEQARAKTEQNLKNTRELFESYLQQVFSQRGEGWVEVPLGSVCNFQNGYAFKSKDTVESSNTQLIRMGNLYKNVLDLSRKSVFYPDNFSDEYEQFKLNEGDMIISLTGTVGKEDYGYTVEIPATDKNLLLNQRIAKIIGIDPEKLEQRFLLRILRSRVFLDELYSTANGTRQANLSTATMKEIMIAIPSADKQRELCREFDGLEAETMKLAKIYNKKLVDLEELKKSILQKAFTGELTKQKEGVAA